MADEQGGPEETPDIQPPNKRKIAIVGTAPSSYRLAPFDDPEWEIWSLSRLYHALPRWDRWFEMHQLEDVCKTWAGVETEAAEARARQEYWAWMKRQDKPIYLQRERPDIAPSGVRYPIEQVLNTFRRKYFTNSISYMMALAILERPPEMGVWGVDMALKEEYREQRPSCEYFIGIADGLGIPCIIPPESNLMKARKLYGYEPEGEWDQMVKAKRLEVQHRIKATQQQLERGRSALDQLVGAKDLLEHMELNWE